MMEQPRSLPPPPPPRMPETVDPLDTVVMSPLHYTELCNSEEDESMKCRVCSRRNSASDGSRQGTPTSTASTPPVTKNATNESGQEQRGDKAALSKLLQTQIASLQKQQPQKPQLPPVPGSPVCDTSVTTECTTTTKSNSHSQVSTAGGVTALDHCELGGGEAKVEAAGGSSSVPTGPEQTSFGPLHQKSIDNHASEDCMMVAQQMKDDLLSKLSLTSRRGKLTMINLSRQGLGIGDAELIKQTMTNCPHLSVLKLSYNNFGDEGTAVIASGFIIDGSHHDNLSVLDLGFNMIGEAGCSSLALHSVAGNRSLRTLYLSGNNICDRGALSLAGAILHGSNLTCLHLTENKIGTVGVKALTRAVAETEALRRADICYGNHQQLGAGVGVAITPGRNSRSTIQTIQELYVGGTCMESAGFLSVSNMVLTNLSLRVLDLSDNDLEDRDIALFSQSITQNRAVPFEVLNFSFNSISCTGVECLMNAVWGSKTLRELRLDNNKVKDRGAQLAAVVLTSIQLKVLDLGFNRITTAGVKALMKSLSETSSLTSLTLSGIPLDLPASKAVCYALAYSTSLRHLFIDNCSVSYSAQRHIVAGIVSNQRASLELVTGFDIGAITVTLGLPAVLESWTNYKVLKFVRMMWQHRHSQQNEARLAQWLKSQSSINALNPDKNYLQSTISNQSVEGLQPDMSQKMEPADPKTVVIAAKAALAYIGNMGDSVLSTESYQRETDQTSPLVPANATMLEKTSSGAVRVPSFSQLTANGDIPSVVESSSQTQRKISQPVGTWGHVSPDGSALGNILDPVRKQKITEWIRTHFRSVKEVGQLPFNSNDLAQLQIYFYSTIDSADGVDDNLSVLSNSDEKEATDADSDERSGTGASRHYSRKLGRKISFHRVQEAANVAAQLQSEAIRSFCKRRSWEMISTDEEESISGSSHDYGPAFKRIKNHNLRISRYPRLQAKLERLRAEAAESQMLSLLRQIRFVETLTLQGRNSSKPTASTHDSDYSYSHADVEIILLDLL